MNDRERTHDHTERFSVSANLAAKAASPDGERVKTVMRDLTVGYVSAILARIMSWFHYLYLAYS
jgi:hypothetical protein